MKSSVNTRVILLIIKKVFWVKFEVENFGAIKNESYKTEWSIVRAMVHEKVS